MAMKLSISIGMLKQDAFKGILYFKSPSGASLLKISAAFRRNIYNPPTSSKSFLKGSSIRSTRIPISVAEKSWDESYDPNVLPAFRVGFDEKPEQVAERIRALFKKVRDDFSEEGVFDAN